MTSSTFARMRTNYVSFAVIVCIAATVTAHAHPGSGIVADAQGNIYFVDTGQGTWRLDGNGKLTLIHTTAFHWMAIDAKGGFASSGSLANSDGGSFERITPAGTVPALVISSDLPVAIGRDGGLYYVPYNEAGRREMIRRMPDGQRSAFARLPTDTGTRQMRWVNGIALAPDGSLYFTDNDAIRKITPGGVVSTFKDFPEAPDCTDPMPKTPKLPFLRGLTVAQDGTVYAAANGCRTLISISPTGTVRTILKADAPWSPTGVVVSGNDIYVLEYLHTASDDRREWIPRVRRVAPDGKVTTVATVQRPKR